MEKWANFALSDGHMPLALPGALDLAVETNERRQAVHANIIFYHTPVNSRQIVDNDGASHELCWVWRRHSFGVRFGCALSFVIHTLFDFLCRLASNVIFRSHKKPPNEQYNVMVSGV